MLINFFEEQNIFHLKNEEIGYEHHFTTFYHAPSLNELKLCKQSFKFP